MGMKIKSTGMGAWEGMGILFFKEIPAPSDSYQIHSNLLIEFTSQ